MIYGNTCTADVSAQLFTMNKYVTVGLQVGFTVVTYVLCSMVGGCECSEGTYCLPLHGRNFENLVVILFGKKKSPILGNPKVH